LAGIEAARVGELDKAVTLLEDGIEGAANAGLEADQTEECTKALALTYLRLGRASQALEQFTGCLDRLESQGAGRGLAAAELLNNLGLCQFKLGRYEQAEQNYLGALKIREAESGGESPATAQTLNNLAALYKFQGRLTEAESLYLRSLAIKRRPGGHQATLGRAYHNLAQLYEIQGRYDGAELNYRRALETWIDFLQPDDPYLAWLKEGYLGILRRLGRYDQADRLQISSDWKAALAALDQAEQSRPTHHDDAPTTVTEGV
jgi:tetratricopeptide (TPR) repeat protein